MELQLYNYFRSSPSYRVRLALHSKGLSFEYKPVHLLNNGGEQNSPEYKSINPAAEVPALWHKGKVFTQSVAIFEYLDECFPHTRLYPADSEPRAHVREFCETINCNHPLANLKVQQYLQKEFKIDDAAKQAWVQHWMRSCFEVLETRLQKSAGKYCFGDNVTAADMFLIPHMFSAKRFQVDLSKFKKIQSIHDNCMKLEFFLKAHPHNQIDTPAEFKGQI